MHTNLPPQRDTLKRMCFKTLPPVMVVHLKRFDYDWEANRAIKFDDLFEVRLHPPKSILDFISLNKYHNGRGLLPDVLL